MNELICRCNLNVFLNCYPLCLSQFIFIGLVSGYFSVVELFKKKKKISSPKCSLTEGSLISQNLFNWTGPMLNNVREESRAEKKGAQDHLTTGIWL